MPPACGDPAGGYPPRNTRAPPPFGRAAPAPPSPASPPPSSSQAPKPANNGYASTMYGMVLGLSHGGISPSSQTDGMRPTETSASSASSGALAEVSPPTTTGRRRRFREVVEKPIDSSSSSEGENGAREGLYDSRPIEGPTLPPSMRRRNQPAGKFLHFSASFLSRKGQWDPWRRN